MNGFCTLVASVAAVGGAVAGCGAVAAFLPGRISLRLVRLGFVAAYIVVAAYCLLVLRAIGVIGQHRLAIDDLPQDGVTLFKLGWSLCGSGDSATCHGHDRACAELASLDDITLYGCAGLCPAGGRGPNS